MPSAVKRDVFCYTRPDSPHPQFGYHIRTVFEPDKNTVIGVSPLTHVLNRLRIDVKIFLPARLFLFEDDPCELPLLLNLTPAELFNVLTLSLRHPNQRFSQSSVLMR